MPKDPVCGNYVDKDTPYKYELEGQTFYFCSEDCAEEFENNPDEYIELAEHPSMSED